MAKPTPADLDDAVEFISIQSWVEEIERGHWPSSWPESDACAGPDWFDVGKLEHLKLFYERVKRVARCRPGALQRVVLGMHTVMDPTNGVVNPDSAWLELHPDLKRKAVAP